MMDLKRHLMRLTPGRIDYSLDALRGDTFGGVISGVILLPLSMGYGVISGLGPVAGLQGTIAVCFFSAVFGGTRGLIGGPNIFSALTMAVLLAEYTDNLAEALTAAMLAGLIHIAFGVIRLGRYVSYTPYALLAGFFTAAGFLMITSQSLPALGLHPVVGVVNNIKTWPGAILAANPDAVVISVVSLVVGALWRGKLARVVPAQPMALAAGTMLGIVWFRDAPTIGAIPYELPTLQLPVLSLDLLLRVLPPAFIMALLTSVGTLVASLQLDVLTGTIHKPNRQLISHGIGNIAAGLTGGMPGATSVASFTNTFSGGRSPVAGIIATLSLLLLVFIIKPVAERIPFAALASIIIINGWNVIDWRFIFNIHRVARGYAFTMLITAFCATFVDFVNAILIGLVASAMTGAQRSENSELQRLISVPLLDREILSEEDGAVTDPFEARSGLVVFPDRVSVASARELTRIVGRDIGGYQIMIFDLSRMVYMDDTAAVMIGQLISAAMAQHSRQFVIVGLSGAVANTLNSMNLLARVPEANFAADMDEAKQIVKPMLLQASPGSIVEQYAND